MKRTSIVFLSATLLASIAFADEDKIIATYKGGEVKESQVMKEIQPFLAAQPGGKDKKFSDFDARIQKDLVYGYIDAKLIEQEASKLGIETSKEFQDKLNNIKRQLVTQEFYERYVKSNVTDKMINAEYDKLAASLKGKEEVKVSHILVASEKEAINVKNKLNKGEKFAKLATEFSTDEATKANGGEIGYITSGQLVPEFENKALSMKVNEISAPVKTQFGWHIINVLDKRPARIPSKEEATPNITNKLGRDAIQQYVTELENKAEIKILLPKAPATNESTKDKAEKGA